MKKSISIPEEMCARIDEKVYLENTKNPQKPTNFSQILCRLVDAGLSCYEVTK